MRVDVASKAVLLPWHGANKEIGAVKIMSRDVDENGKSKIRSTFKRFRFVFPFVCIRIYELLCNI